MFWCGLGVCTIWAMMAFHKMKTEQANFAELDDTKWKQSWTPSLSIWSLVSPPYKIRHFTHRQPLVKIQLEHMVEQGNAVHYLSPHQMRPSPRLMHAFCPRCRAGTMRMHKKLWNAIMQVKSASALKMTKIFESEPNSTFFHALWKPQNIRA